jgi:hypothetical protein
VNTWRQRPPPTLQGALTCWAAAISSFGRVTRGVPDWKAPSDVIKHFKAALPDELNADGTLKTPSGWIAFAKAFDLAIEEIRANHRVGGPGTATGGITSTVVDDLAQEHFAGKLKKSHVIIVIAPENEDNPSHTVVVYGTDRFRLCFMDPLSDPSLPLTSPRPPGGSGRVDKNWFCDTYHEFPSGFPSGHRFLLIWRD